jgi:hypothetical protein
VVSFHASIQVPEKAATARMGFGNHNLVNSHGPSPLIAATFRSFPKSYGNFANAAIAVSQMQQAK